MSLPLNAARSQYPLFIKLWFLLDSIFCCFPPIYLTFSGVGKGIPIPLSIMYFLLCGLLVTGSILAAFWFYEKQSERENSPGSSPSAMSRCFSLWS